MFNELENRQPRAQRTAQMQETQLALAVPKESPHIVYPKDSNFRSQNPKTSAFAWLTLMFFIHKHTVVPHYTDSHPKLAFLPRGSYDIRTNPQFPILQHQGKKGEAKRGKRGSVAVLGVPRLVPLMPLSQDLHPGFRMYILRPQIPPTSPHNYYKPIKQHVSI